MSRLGKFSNREKCSGFVPANSGWLPACVFLDLAEFGGAVAGEVGVLEGTGFGEVHEELRCFGNSDFGAADDAVEDVGDGFETGD